MKVKLFQRSVSRLMLSFRYIDAIHSHGEDIHTPSSCSHRFGKKMKKAMQ